MKKIIIEIKQTDCLSSNKNVIDEAYGDDKLQSDVKKVVDNISNPVGAIKSKIDDLAGTKGLAIAGAVIAVSQEVLGQISASVNFAISGIGMTTGNSSLQERVMREQEKVQEGVSMAKSVLGGVAAGAAIGASFGAIGILVGAIGGAVFGGVAGEVDKQRNTNTDSK